MIDQLNGRTSHVEDRFVVEDVEHLADALRTFGADLPLRATLVVELISDDVGALSINIRHADSVADLEAA